MDLLSGDADLIYDIRKRIDDLELRSLEDFKAWIKSLSDEECKAIAIVFFKEWMSRSGRLHSEESHGTRR